MRKLYFVCLVLMCGFGRIYAQLPENVSRNVIATLETSEVVNPGEFQMELQKGVFFDADSENPWFSFIYTQSNRFTGAGNIVVNNVPKVINKEAVVRTYKIAATLEKCVFVIKNMGSSTNSMRHNMEYVMANGILYPVCDSVLYINDDGYVFSMEGNTYYNLFRNSTDNQSHTEKIVWLMKKNYESGMISGSKEKIDALARLSSGDVYYESTEGHYYYLFRDKYMPYTVMVVDNQVIELHDIYDEDNFKFKFSYNGKHWMAVGKQCFWVDGAIKSVEGYCITDFVITNKGDYCYTAYKVGEQDKGEVVVYNGKIIRRNSDVCYFGMNGEGNLKIRFVAGDRYLQYDNEKIVDVTEEMVSVYYPGDDKSRKVRVLSSDGAHKLTYHHGEPSVEIDGVKVADSEPCYAVFDQRNNAFIWNAIETRDMKTELVIYKYTIVNNLFKKIFK
jgi:hypothetical protein